jgi:hypothetical protein
VPTARSWQRSFFVGIASALICYHHCAGPGRARRLDGHHLSLPLRLAHLVLQHLHDAEAAWESSRSASTAPWLFAGPNPARPIQSQYIYPKLRRALAGDVSASVLAPLTGTSIDNATRWANFVKRNWTDYIAGGKGA